MGKGPPEKGFGGVVHRVKLLAWQKIRRSLLNLDQDRDLVKRFKEMIVKLLGNAPRLDSWVEQFYKARSSIVHDGSWPHLMFYPTDSQQIGEIYKGKKNEIEYLPLISYGWRVFRLCFNIIVSGAKLAIETNLSAALVPNQERLERICQLFKKSDSSIHNKQEELSGLVIDLRENYAFVKEQVRTETVLSVAKSLVRFCLDSDHDLPEQIIDKMKDVIAEDIDEKVRIEALNSLRRSIDNWTRSDFGAQKGVTLQPFELVRLFTNYTLLARIH